MNQRPVGDRMTGVCRLLGKPPAVVAETMDHGHGDDDAENHVNDGSSGS